MKYFVSGHRDLSKENFDRYYIPLIEEVIKVDGGAQFLVGDCEGVDTFAWEYLAGHNYWVTKHCLGLGELKYSIDYDRHQTFVVGFKDDIERDDYMTRNSDYDIAILFNDRWNSGTGENIERRRDYMNKYIRLEQT